MLAASWIPRWVQGTSLPSASSGKDGSTVKKLLVGVLCFAFVCSLGMGLVGCGDKKKDDKKPTEEKKEEKKTT
jgi:hypothetical protein